MGLYYTHDTLNENSLLTVVFGLCDLVSVHLFMGVWVWVWVYLCACLSVVGWGGVGKGGGANVRVHRSNGEQMSGRAFVR